MKKKFRVLKNLEFNKIKKNSKITKDKFFVLYSIDKKEDYARVGISVSKRIGIAVIRNKVKRQLKSIIQQNINFNTCKFDLLIYPRSQYDFKNFDQMKTTLLKLFKKIGVN